MILVQKTAPADSTESRLKSEILASAFSHNADILFAERSGSSRLRFEFDYEEPENVDAYHLHLEARCSFRHSRCRFVVPDELLDQPLPFRNAHTTAVLEKVCSTALEAVQPEWPLDQQVHSIIQGVPGLSPALSQVASGLGVSARTLSRRLSEQGRSFDEIRMGVRRARAEDLLLATTLSISEIASIVGFESASNFSRAFTQWTNRSPSAFRKRNN